MAAPIEFEITMGEVLVMSVFETPLADISAVPITIVMDGPIGSPRRTLRHLNGGSDGELYDSDRKVKFLKDNDWTANNLSPGQWTLIVLRGDQDTEQVVIGRATMNVIRPAGGPLPTGG